MSFKINLASKVLTRLPGFSLLGFEGIEAMAFLQAQTMNDVSALATGQWHWNGWLNPKGRVIALFALLRQDENAFIAILPDFSANELLPRLQRFVFRSKVRLRTVDELVCAAQFDVASAPSPASDIAQGSLESGLVLDFSGEKNRRYLWLLPQEHAVGLTSSTDKDTRWLSEDLAHGLPRLPASQREMWTPQMLSLERLHAFSLKKGCYPGQEIVARTHYLGQAKRGLVRVQGAGIHLAEPLHDKDGNAIGNVICEAGQGHEGLAVIQPDPAKRSVWVNGHEAILVPLLPGLQRPILREFTPSV